MIPADLADRLLSVAGVVAVALGGSRAVTVAAADRLVADVIDWMS